MTFKCSEKGVLYEMVVAHTRLSETQRLGLFLGDGEGKSPAIENLGCILQPITLGLSHT